MIKTQALTFTYESFIKSPGIKGAWHDFFHRQTNTIEALKSNQITINDGEMVGLVGPNGAGKTTFIKLLTGILTPTTGSVIVDDRHPAYREAKYLQKVGILFGQKSQLSWDLPAIDTLNMLAYIYKLPHSRYLQRLNTLVDMLDANQFINQPVRKLSLGQRVRCELICALIHEPKYLFLDEPTLGLDLLTQQHIYKFLRAENRQRHTTILITSHYLKDIEMLSDKLLILVDGKFVYQGNTNQLPVHPSDSDTFECTYLTENGQTKQVQLDAGELNEFMQKTATHNIVNIKRNGSSLEDFIKKLYLEKTNL
ncbi:ABC transporter ATP-binding protein [Apilactobacillus xinyiensis]|uniref:ABC transporter ATP-binding protein n=1 Tax=Apilactobacillus xinyiensis TaxID=2841032 RepID=UPI0020106778|nr:ATP-binding cassette domain-containing protein [Apilactobacillus xinyiensis]MCL0319303.1 ATP-binding cassette domain-containing protein [Apilactobacillus xinyiensis]